MKKLKVFLIIILHTSLVFGQIQLLNFEPTKTKVCGCMKGDTLQMWVNYEDAFATVGIFEGVIDSNKKNQNLQNLLTSALYDVEVYKKDTSVNGVYFKVFENEKPLTYNIQGTILTARAKIALDYDKKSNMTLANHSLKFPFEGQLSIKSLGFAFEKNLIFENQKVYYVNFNSLNDANSHNSIVIAPSLKLFFDKKIVKIGKLKMPIVFHPNGCFKKGK